MKLYLPLSKMFVYVVVGFILILIIYFIPSLRKQVDMIAIIYGHFYLTFSLIGMSLLWARKENK